MLGWSLDLTNVAIGGLVIVYTVAGGTKAVSQTQKQQMVVMMGGLAVAFVWVRVAACRRRSRSATPCTSPAPWAR